MAALEVNQLPPAPLGGGDLIDRAVRLYRRHVFTLIRIAAPPGWEWRGSDGQPNTTDCGNHHPTPEFAGHPA
jgi:hypothetical protein